MQIKLSLWNMEWLNDLFVSGSGPAQFRPDGEKAAHASRGVTVRKRRNDLAAVVTEINLDVVSSLKARSATRNCSACSKPISASVGRRLFSQRRARADGRRCDQHRHWQIDPAATRRLDSAINPAFQNFQSDTDDDLVEEIYHFERLPVDLEVALSDGKRLRILGVHLKSKAIFDAYEWSRWWSVSEGNRRKILAQAMQIRRQFVEPSLAAPATKDVPLIVCGDLNDGPGLDAAEKRLFGSGIGKLMGEVWAPKVCLGNTLYDILDEDDKREMNFELLATTRF